MGIRFIYNALTTFWHILVLRWGGVKIPKRIRFCGRINFQLSKGSTFRINTGSVITGGAYSNALGCLRGSCVRVEKDATLIIGENCGLSDVSIWARDTIIIGNYVTVGAETILNDSNSHCLNFMERRAEHRRELDWQSLNIKKSPIVIEDDVFIGARCIIGKGVTIGERSVIAAGSVVVKSIPPDEVWGGNPAKFIRNL